MLPNICSKNKQDYMWSNNILHEICSKSSSAQNVQQEVKPQMSFAKQPAQHLQHKMSTDLIYKQKFHQKGWNSAEMATEFLQHKIIYKGCLDIPKMWGGDEHSKVILYCYIVFL